MSVYNDIFVWNGILKPLKVMENITAKDTQQKIVNIELEINKRLIDILTSCDEEIGIRILDNSFVREERESAFPVQLDIVKWRDIYPNGIPDKARQLNGKNIFGNVIPGG